MTDLSEKARAHHAQCHRKDESERLLLALADENDRLRAELAATLEREDLAREERNTLDAMALNGGGND